MFDATIIMIAALFGALMGLLYTFSGFRDNQKSESLQKNARTKNLLWVLGGAVAAIMADWKILSPDSLTPSQRGIVFISYLSACIVVIFFSLLIISIAIFINNRFLRKDSPSLRRASFDLLLEFLHYGYPKYSEMAKLAEGNSSSEEIHNRENMAQLGGALGLSIAISIRDSNSNVPNDNKILTIDSLLQNIESTVVLMAGSPKDLQIRANYMLAMTKEKCERDKVCEASFVFGNKARFERFLVLQRYRGKRGVEMCLPIEPQGSPSPKLPGAPEAFILGEPRLINCADQNIGKALPNDTKRKISKFLKEAPFKSFLSLPIQKGAKTVGVLNIESNRVDILGQNNDMVERVARVLHPYCLLLGEVAGSIEDEVAR